MLCNLSIGGVVLLGAITYVFIKLVRAYYAKKPFRSPLSFENYQTLPTTKRTKESYITNEKAKVIKQVFKANEVPEQLDAIVIGSGIGGLSTAGLLAKAGKRVLVLEQHDQAGGCCHTFEDHGFEFDIGIHYIGGLDRGSNSRILLDILSDNQLDWHPIDANYDTVVLVRDGQCQTFPITVKDKFLSSFSDGFDAYKEKIHAFLKECISTDFFSFFYYLKIIPLWLATGAIKSGLLGLLVKLFKIKLHLKPLKRVLNEQFGEGHNDMKTVLSYCFGDYGVVPSETPVGMHAVLLRHYWRGAYYPVGGASDIAYTIIPVIERAGGKVFVRANVTRIIVEPDAANNSRLKCVGVSVQRGNESYDVFAPVVASAGGCINMLALLPEHARPQCHVHRLLRDRAVRSGVSCMQLFVGLDGDADDLQLSPRNYWMYFSDKSLDDMINEYMALSLADAVEIDAPMLFVSFPSAKDPTWKERYPKKSTCVVVSLAPYSWFSEWASEPCQRRGADYESLKTALGNRLWNQTLTMFGHLADKVVFKQVGSPLSHQHYLNSPEGEIYGLHHDVERFTPMAQALLRAESGVESLYLSGQDLTSAGFTGALFGGVLCAERILNCYLMKDLMSTRRKVLAAGR